MESSQVGFWTSKSKIKKEDIAKKLDEVETYAYATDQEVQALKRNVERLESEKNHLAQLIKHRMELMQRRMESMEQFCVKLGYDPNNHGNFMHSKNVVSELKDLRIRVREIKSSQINEETFLEHSGYQTNKRYK